MIESLKGNNNSFKKGYVLLLLAGIFWGTLGIFGEILFKYGLNPELVVFYRLFLGFISLFLIILFMDKSLLKIDFRGIKYTFFMGITTQSIFNILYFKTIDISTPTTAVVLLYTCPVFLTIIGKIFYKENLTKTKLISIALCIIGCFLTVTGGNISVLNMNFLAIVLGLGSGFTYSLVTVFSKKLLNDYNPLTIILYSFLFGAICLIPISNPIALLKIKITIGLIITLMSLGIFAAALSYIFYVKGLSYGVEASKAGIIASSEVIVATILSVIFLGEHLIFIKILGVLLLLSSIVITNINNKNNEEIIEQALE